MHIVPQESVQVKSAHYQRNSEILALADLALNQFNQHWARFIATGSDEAYRLALAARNDRAALLGEVNHD